MKVITMVNKYRDSDKDIFIETAKNRFLIKIEKDKNFFIEYGYEIANAKIKNVVITDTLVSISI